MNRWKFYANNIYCLILQIGHPAIIGICIGGISPTTTSVGGFTGWMQPISIISHSSFFFSLVIVQFCQYGGKYLHLIITLRAITRSKNRNAKLIFGLNIIRRATWHISEIYTLKFHHLYIFYLCLKQRYISKKGN